MKSIFNNMKINIVSSDEIRLKLINEERLKNPKLSIDDLFSRTGSKANKIYDETVVQYLRNEG